MRAPLGRRQVQHLQQCPLARPPTPASDGRATTGSLPSRTCAHTLQCRFALAPTWPGTSRLPFCQVGSATAAVTVAIAVVCSPLQIGRLPLARNRALRSDGSRCAASLVWLCGHHGLNSLQPPVPILAALGYKPNTSLKARAALQVTMFSTPHFCHASFALRCTGVGAAAASVSSVSLPSMSRRRANHSLELTCPGRPSWPRSSRDFAHFLLRGQAVLPGHAAQLKR